MRGEAVLDDRSLVSGQHVDVDNFIRAETDRMFGSFVHDAGGVNRLIHGREPTPLDHQPVIRMNRDTLYSFAVVDIASGATITVPASGERYVSVMVVNQSHYVNHIYHDAGTYELTVDEFDTPYVTVAIRVLADPNNEDDLATVHALQDLFQLDAKSARPFEPLEWDPASLDATRNAILELAKHVSGFGGAFGSKAEVDPVKHLIGTAAGWGGLPSYEAFYINVDPELPVGKYELHVSEVPVDGFWSISVYNAEGYFPNTDHPVSLNNITAAREPDGSINVHFGNWEPDTSNQVSVSDGWNYLIRLYQPHPEILDGSWTFPTIRIP
jgi:hypothetical protein